MKFIVSSGQLLRALQTVSGVIQSNNTLPILDHFLVHLDPGEINDYGVRPRNDDDHPFIGGFVRIDHGSHSRTHAVGHRQELSRTALDLHPQSGKPCARSK